MGLDLKLSNLGPCPDSTNNNEYYRAPQYRCLRTKRPYRNTAIYGDMRSDLHFAVYYAYLGTEKTHKENSHKD